MKKDHHKCCRCERFEHKRYLHSPVRYKGRTYWEHLGACDAYRNGSSEQGHDAENKEEIDEG